RARGAAAADAGRAARGGAGLGPAGAHLPRRVGRAGRALARRVAAAQPRPAGGPAGLAQGHRGRAGALPRPRGVLAPDPAAGRPVMPRWRAPLAAEVAEHTALRITPVQLLPQVVGLQHDLHLQLGHESRLYAWAQAYLAEARAAVTEQDVWYPTAL